MSRQNVRDKVYENEAEEDQEYNECPAVAAAGEMANQLHTAFPTSLDTFFANLPPASTAGGYGTYTPASAGYLEPQYTDAAGTVAAPADQAAPMSVVAVSDHEMYPPALFDPSMASYSLPTVPASQAPYSQDPYALPTLTTATATASSPHKKTQSFTTSPASLTPSRGGKRPRNPSASSSSRSRGSSLSIPSKTVRQLAPAQPGTSTFPVSPTASSRPQLRTASRAPKRYNPATAAMRRPAENEDEERSRSLHNRAEQNYRQRLNGGYDDLLSILPDEADDDNDGGDGGVSGNGNRYKSLAGIADKKRVSKAQVLDRATKRIRALEEQGEELERRRLELQRMEALYREGRDGGEDGDGGQEPST